MDKLFIVFLCIGIFCTGFISLFGFIVATELVLILNCAEDERDY